jgi:cap1 methyltransferase
MEKTMACKRYIEQSFISIFNYSSFQGFGFTLKGKSDFTLHKFIAGSPETFDPYYGVNHIDGDGDIFKSENIDALQNYVYKCTAHSGVHIVMADGVSLQENK